MGNMINCDYLNYALGHHNMNILNNEIKIENKTFVRIVNLFK